MKFLLLQNFRNAYSMGVGVYVKKCNLEEDENITTCEARES